MIGLAELCLKETFALQKLEEKIAQSCHSCLGDGIGKYVGSQTRNSEEKLTAFA